MQPTLHEWNRVWECTQQTHLEIGCVCVRNEANTRHRGGQHSIFNRVENRCVENRCVSFSLCVRDNPWEFSLTHLDTCFQHTFLSFFLFVFLSRTPESIFLSFFLFVFLSHTPESIFLSFFLFFFFCLYVCMCRRLRVFVCRVAERNPKP